MSGKNSDLSYRRYRQYRANVHKYNTDQIAAPIAMMILIYIFSEYWLIILGLCSFCSLYCIYKRKKKIEDVQTKENVRKEIKGIEMKRRVEKQMVYDYLATIPKGKVVTYGQIAEYLGDKKLSRTVGNILHNNPDGEKYPCYKVVNSKGKLAESYAFGGIEQQRSKLAAEGVVVENNKVDLKIYKW